MLRSFLVVVLVSTTLWTALPHPSAWGQVSQANRSGPSRPRGLMSQGDIQRLGMERAWFAQLSLGRSYGEVVDIHQYVSVLDTRYSVEVTWKEGRGRRLIRETDLDSLGVVLGAERAKRRAEVLQGELERLGETAELRERTDTPVITLHASTNRGVVHSIDAETGRTNWVTTIGSPRHPTTEVGANEMYVAVLNGTTLYVLNRDDGTVAWTRRTQGVPGAGPSLSGTLCFVPMFTGAVEAFNLESPETFVGLYRSTGRAEIQPLITSTKVCWPTDRGALYVGHSNQYGVLFRIEADRSIVSQPAYANSLFYFTSLDGYLYAVHERTGTIVWTLALGEPLRQSPVVMEENLFVVGDDRTLFCRDSLTGVGLWEYPGIRQFLAASSERVYCLGEDGSLVILNRKSRALLGRIDIRSLNFPMTNTLTDRVYLSTRSGLLQCFREISAEFPEMHVEMDALRLRQLPPPEDEDEEEEPAQPTRRPPPADPMDDDPFGAPPQRPEADDPFGDPFGAPADADDDPFGDPFGAPADADDDPFGAPADDDDPFGNPFE